MLLTLSCYGNIGGMGGKSLKKLRMVYYFSNFDRRKHELNYKLSITKKGDVF